MLKNRLKKEGSQTFTKCNCLKLTAKDGRSRFTDTNFFRNAKMKPSQPILASPDKVVDQALKALDKNKMYVVCGPFVNKIFAQLRRFFTRNFLAKIIKYKTRGRAKT